MTPGAMLALDETTAVYKVGNKIFALIDEESNPPRINLKCDPYYAREIREMYESVISGYHMNKKHWNTVVVDGSVSKKILKECDIIAEIPMKGKKESLNVSVALGILLFRILE